MRLCALFVLSLCLAACSGSSGYDCMGHSCRCADGDTCLTSPCDSSTSSCAFTCSTGSDCAGTCGDTCQVTCNGNNCTIAVGPNSSLSCNKGNCNFTCNGGCAVTGNGARVTCVGSTPDSSDPGCH